ncbi:hypothetical protein EVAR_41960_1 [Eumeta japonica]|uniref:Uncharacterized protein n=1 Tax=Eumeta variegata TaxID=151549 RepID=A0A4C1WSL0_EUMVA|nr:hypothetical protein EVAR_41960_1 [Eumeta japonica]
MNCMGPGSELHLGGNYWKRRLIMGEAARLRHTSRSLTEILYERKKETRAGPGVFHILVTRRRKMLSSKTISYASGPRPARPARESKAKLKSKSGAKPKSRLVRDETDDEERDRDHDGHSVKLELKARRRAESRTGPESELKATPEPKSKTRLGSKMSGDGIRIKSVTVIGIENEKGVEIDIDRYEGKKVILRPCWRSLTIRESYLQENEEQRLSGQPPESRRSPPPMDTSDPIRLTCTLPARS